jgi:2Fe-2S ferredoxin
MPQITYIEYDGRSHVVEVKLDLSVMEGALKNNVPGIEADCGGACSCATCHCYIDEAWTERVGPPSELERSMLDFADEVQANSRLGCQIKMTEALSGLVVSMPKTQR